MPAIPYLVPEFVSVAAKNSVPHSGVRFPLLSWVLRTAEFSVLSAFSAFSGFQGSKSGIPVFPFSALGLQTQNSGVMSPATFGAATFGVHRIFEAPKCL